jgi:hypothetical protein
MFLEGHKFSLIERIEIVKRLMSDHFVFLLGYLNLLVYSCAFLGLVDVHKIVKLIVLFGLLYVLNLVFYFVVGYLSNYLFAFLMRFTPQD